jgi:preprotein translocase subunit YajC
MNYTINILATAAQPAGQGMNSIIMMVLMFVIFWVVLIRPQQKQRKELAARQSALKKGDKVITVSGLHGTVNAVSDQTVSLKVADGIFMKFDKVAIASINPEKKAKVEPKAVRG